eukprot:193842-Prorocentrum_minimum.AAC.1
MYTPGVAQRRLCRCAIVLLCRCVVYWSMPQARRSPGPPHDCMTVPPASTRSGEERVADAVKATLAGVKKTMLDSWEGLEGGSLPGARA